MYKTEREGGERGGGEVTLDHEGGESHCLSSRREEDEEEKEEEEEET